MYSSWLILTTLVCLYLKHIYVFKINNHKIYTGCKMVNVGPKRWFLPNIILKKLENLESKNKHLSQVKIWRKVSVAPYFCLIWPWDWNLPMILNTDILGYTPTAFMPPSIRVLYYGVLPRALRKPESWRYKRLALDIEQKGISVRNWPLKHEWQEEGYTIKFSLSQNKSQDKLLQI